MPNYKLTKDGFVTSDPVIAAMCYEYVQCNYAIDDFLNGNAEMVVPYITLKWMLKPVEGEAFVEIGFGDVATDGLILYGANDTMTKPDVEKRLNWRVINMCQDYGELCELLVAIERCG